MKVDQKLLDRFNYLLNETTHFSIKGRMFFHRFRRTPNAFKSEIVDISTGKVVASGYVFDLVEKGGELYGRMGRLYVKELYRGLKLGSMAFDARVSSFGPNVNLYLSAHPNRTASLNESNFEGYRDILFTMYGKRGFIKVDGTKATMRRPKGDFIYKEKE